MQKIKWALASSVLDFTLGPACHLREDMGLKPTLIESVRGAEAHGNLINHEEKFRYIHHGMEALSNGLLQLFDAVLFHFQVKRLTINIKDSRSLGFVVANLLEGLHDHFLLLCFLECFKI